MTTAISTIILTCAYFNGALDLPTAVDWLFKYQGGVFHRVNMPLFEIFLGIFFIISILLNRREVK